MQITPINVGPVTQTSGFAVASANTITTLVSGQVYFLFQNNGTADVNLGFSGTAPTGTTGITVKANGGSIEFVNFIPTGAVAVYATASGSHAYTFLVA
jgi:hypothetical protein